jgi:hypothetical protein
MPSSRRFYHDLLMPFCHALSPLFFAMPSSCHFLLCPIPAIFCHTPFSTLRGPLEGVGPGNRDFLGPEMATRVSLCPSPAIFCHALFRPFLPSSLPAILCHALFPPFFTMPSSCLFAMPSFRYFSPCPRPAIFRHALFPAFFAMTSPFHFLPCHFLSLFCLLLFSDILISTRKGCFM